MESRERVDFLRCGGEGKRRNKDLFFFAVLSSPFSPETYICVRDFFVLLFFKEALTGGYPLFPCRVATLAQSVFPLPSPSSQRVEVFSLALRGRGWGRASLPRLQQCPRELSRKLHAPGIS